MRRYAKDAALQVRLESDLRVKVGACVVRGGRILGLASNKSGSGRRGTWSRHAEVRACLNRDVRGASIYIARGHGITGSLRFSRPCGSCMELLAEVGIKKVYFTVDGGWEKL